MTNLLQIFMLLPGLISSIEAAYPQGGGGKDKLAAVLNALTTMLPAGQAPNFMQSFWPQIQTYVGVLVSIYNATQFFKHGGTSQAPVAFPIGTPGASVIDPYSLVTAAMTHTTQA